MDATTLMDLGQLSENNKDETICHISQKESVG